MGQTHIGKSDIEPTGSVPKKALMRFMDIGAPSFRTSKDTNKFYAAIDNLKRPSERIIKAYRMSQIGIRLNEIINIDKNGRNAARRKLESDPHFNLKKMLIKMNARQLNDCLCICRLGMGTVKVETYAYSGSTEMLIELGDGRELVDNKYGIWKVPINDDSRLMMNTFGQEKKNTDIFQRKALENFMLLGAPRLKTNEDREKFYEIYNALKKPSSEIQEAYRKMLYGSILNIKSFGDDIEEKRKNIETDVSAESRQNISALSKIELEECLCLFELGLDPVKEGHISYTGNTEMLIKLGEGRKLVRIGKDKDNIWQVPVNEKNVNFLYYN